ncbi:hypothetical protein PDESU_05639 [Pontiella desulfatans]|uniref:DUF2281 domain-containing protein n=1 Tax=Pontiella desulfatans TaxID=2750659 RepID=A0A6C2UAL1_PONDE|nr:DUF2281 domain-containing protein [Pontiella desulfatans]VGO17045.1 hypothetical protein PDESU_05639 [Pontiella desulfatans]
MTIAELISQQVKKLSDAGQLEVLDYVEFIEQKYQARSFVAENNDWSEMSVGAAMHGMEDEPSLYSLDDIIEA